MPARPPDSRPTAETDSVRRASARMRERSRELVAHSKQLVESSRDCLARSRATLVRLANPPRNNAGSAGLPIAEHGRPDRARARDRTMAAHAGETAQETGDFRCAKCREQVHVTKGKKIPKCPNCGNAAFDTRYHEPQRKSG